MQFKAEATLDHQQQEFPLLAKTQQGMIEAMINTNTKLKLKDIIQTIDHSTISQELAGRVEALTLANRLLNGVND